MLCLSSIPYNNLPLLLQPNDRVRKRGETDPTRYIGEVQSFGL